jgi:phosphoserine phosphatase RsbU/P
MSTAAPIDVVIAEDSRLQARMLQKHLEQAGYTVRWGATGAAALDLIREQRPAIIVSDIEMPEMNGYELCRACKEDASLRRIPLILLSTLSSPEDIIEGLQAGADNYVTKPYEAEYLLGRMRSLLDTPLGDEQDDGPTLEVALAGKRYSVRSGRQQVLNLLISTFENAVEKNRELITSNRELSLARDQLEQQNDALAKLNDRMKSDLHAAAKIQQSLLPGDDNHVDGLPAAWRFVPCDELAGDFLNFFALDDRHVAIYVVDVSGHGVASSLLSVTVARSLTRQVSTSSILVRDDGQGTVAVVPPGQVVAELNRRFPMEQQGGLYFTILYGILDTQTGTFRYVSAGHVPPVVVAADGTATVLPAEGFAVGWMEDVEADEVVVQLKAGDRLYLFSDGVNEAMDDQLEEFGQERLVENLVFSRSQSIDESVQILRGALDQWCRIHGPKDDISILAIERC